MIKLVVVVAMGVDEVVSMLLLFWSKSCLVVVYEEDDLIERSMRVYEAYAIVKLH